MERPENEETAKNGNNDLKTSCYLQFFNMGAKTVFT